MMQEEKLSLFTATIININIMLGVGVFINIVELAKRAGAFGALSYGIIGILFLPLIFSIVSLLRLYPEGGFYMFSSSIIGPSAGFISAWSYFVAKLASATLAIHTFVLLLQEVIDVCAGFNPLFLDVIVLGVIIIFNMLNVRAGSLIQIAFVLFKMFPIILFVLLGIFFIRGDYIDIAFPCVESIIGTFPLVIHSVIGFEAACSISSKIKDSHKNAPRAILISYGIVIIMYCVFQAVFYGVLGSDLVQLPDYRLAFPSFLAVIFSTSSSLFLFVKSLCIIAIALAVLGGGYGMIYSNVWNCYILAKHNHTFMPHILLKLNKNNIPFVCVMVEGVICLMFLLITYGNQLSLQKIAALGCVIAYTISVCALLLHTIRNNAKYLLLPVLGLGSCLLLGGACVFSFFQSINDIILFVGILMFGCVMFWYKRT